MLRVLFAMSASTFLLFALNAALGDEQETKLGKSLFNDPALSKDRSVSCASCHIPSRNWTSGGLPPKIGGGRLDTRAPSVNSVGDQKMFLSDGRANSLPGQIRGVLSNPIEMGEQTVEQVFQRVRRKYPGLQSADEMVDAIAAYVTTIRTPPSKLERYLDGENTLNESEARGWDVFRGAGRCYICHKVETNFSDGAFHNTGIGMFKDKKGWHTNNAGRYNVSKVNKDFGAFKTPGLRNCAAGGPYMHDASIKTLEDIVEFYDQGGRYNSKLSEHMQPLRLSKKQKEDLVALLRCL